MWEWEEGESVGVGRRGECGNRRVGSVGVGERREYGNGREGSVGVGGRGECGSEHIWNMLGLGSKQGRQVSTECHDQTIKRCRKRQKIKEALRSISTLMQFS